MTEIALISKALAWFEDGSDDGRVHQLGVGDDIPEIIRMQPNVEYMHLADPGFILRHQKGRLIYLKTEGMIGPDDGVAPGTAAYEQAAGDIDGDHLVTRPVQVLYEQ